MRQNHLHFCAQTSGECLMPLFATLKPVWKKWYYHLFCLIGKGTCWRVIEAFLALLANDVLLLLLRLLNSEWTVSMLLLHYQLGDLLCKELMNVLQHFLWYWIFLGSGCFSLVCSLHFWLPGKFSHGFNKQLLYSTLRSELHSSCLFFFTLSLYKNSGRAMVAWFAVAFTTTWCKTQNPNNLWTEKHNSCPLASDLKLPVSLA